MKDKKESTELTKEELNRMYEDYEYQLDGERENAIYEAELDIRELELERKIKGLEELKRSRRSVIFLGY